MRRAYLIVVWVVLAPLLIVALGFAFMFLLLLWSIMGPDPEVVLARAQPTGDRIAAALEEHHRRHGRYPLELADLVKEGLLKEVPELPPHWGTSSPYGPDYESNASLDFYKLSFSYHVKGGIGPGDTYWQVLVSDDRAGWKTTQSPDSMEDLVAERVLATYRKQHDSKSLELFMSDVVKKAGCNHLYRDRVVRWLGEGVEIELPPDLMGSGKKGYVYQAQDAPERRYCFVYKDHWLPILKSWLSDEERARLPRTNGEPDDTMVNKNYPVLDKLFLIQETEGRPTWTIVRECPASPMDKPSGRYETVDAAPTQP